MENVIQFRPRPRDAIEIENVQIIGMVPAGARIISPADAAMSGAVQSISGHGVTVFYEQCQDTAPAEYCAPASDGA